MPSLVTLGNKCPRAVHCKSHPIPNLAQTSNYILHPPQLPRHKIFAVLHSSSKINHEEPSTFVPAAQRYTVAPREKKYLGRKAAKLTKYSNLPY